MPEPADPFVHHPELRPKIVLAEASAFRDMDLAMMDEKMRGIGAPADWRHPDAYREQSRMATMQGRPDGDLWVFAYGSLMWDPAFHFDEVRTARLPGYQRRFCMKSVLGRGSPENPGLMAGLDHGDGCDGLVFRVPGDLIDQETRIIWRREMLLHAYAPAFLPVTTDAGGLAALAFVVDPTADSYLPNLSVDETARYMATGVGVFGSSLDYLENLGEQLAALGIVDAALNELSDRTRRLAA